MSTTGESKTTERNGSAGSSWHPTAIDDTGSLNGSFPRGCSTIAGSEKTRRLMYKGFP